MRRLSAILLGLIFVVPVHAQDQESDRVRLVATGEIRKLDTKKGTFEIKLTFDAPTGGGSQQPINRTNPGVGGRGGGRRGGGMGYPGGGGQGQGRRPTLQQAGPSTLQVKVFTSEKTTLKESNHTFEFPALKVGQSVTVTAIHKGAKGNDLDALVVDKTPVK